MLLPSSEVTPTTKDKRGRALRDLRISVTDRCNFRCRYCMPREHVHQESFLARDEILSFEEIVLVAESFVALGVQKIRLTGGEPLLRNDLSRLVGMLSGLGVDLALTTNGVRLPGQATLLKQAGLRRITVSLDALDEATFQNVCDAPGFRVTDVLRGIDAAVAAGFEKIKINCVVQRGQNDDQVEKLFRHFEATPHVLRFIEFMDVGTKNAWSPASVVSRDEILARLGSHGPLRQVPPKQRGQVAESYRVGPLGREIGIIASVSQPFCGECSRARLSANGHLYSCLFAEEGLSIKERLRTSEDRASLEQEIRGWWERRTDRYSEEREVLLSANLLSRDALSRDTVSASATRKLPVLQKRVEMSFIGG